MQAGRPSETAESVAIRRAAHQLLDSPLIFEDPLALPILRPELAAALRSGRRRTEHNRFSRYLRAFLAVRSRYAEEHLATAVEAGVRQYVILGAGLDTFAYRSPHRGLRVFEVDYPATQIWKKSRLADAGIAAPNSLTYVAADLEHETLPRVLKAAGFDTTAPAYFSWLGVTPYLEREAIHATLKFIASLPYPSAVAFDYVVWKSALNWAERLVFNALTIRLALMGEAWRTAFKPPELEYELRGLGFTEIEDLNGDAINQRYLANRSDGLRTGSIGRLVHARVGKRGPG